jgi:hypothetical protein
MKITGLLLIIGCLQVFNVWADDTSARRYAALTEPSIVDKYFLLSQKAVQENLGLSPSQITALKSAMLSPSTNQPAIAEFRRVHKQLLAAAHSREERAEIQREGNKQFSLLINQYLESSLQTALAPAQTNRLNELFFQMKGPHALLDNTNIAVKLNLTKAQMDELNFVTNSNGQFLFLLRARFLSLQIQPERKRESSDTASEMECVARVIKEVEKDQDAEFLAMLTGEQRRSWNDLCGPPVPIDWKIQYFSDVPFQEEGQ